MADTASDYFVKRLHKWGIRRIYGFPGDGINGVMGALNRHQHLIEFIQCRHEEEAAFAACAHAKLTGELGVCLGTSGPGAIHLLNGLYDAKLDHMPVLAILGQQKVISLGASFQQEVDLQSLYKDVAKEYVAMAMNTTQVRQITDRAVRIAMAEKAVTAVILPADVQESPASDGPPREHGCTYTGVGYSEPEIIPRESDIKHAAEIINSGKKVGVMIGAGARNARNELEEMCDILQCGVTKALLGKDVLPDDLPYVTGLSGLLGTKPSYDMMRECDTFIMIGSGFPYAEWLPKEGQARGVQIDIDPRMLSLRFPAEAPLQGDAKLTLQKLIPMLKRKTDKSWRNGIEEGVRKWWDLLEKEAGLSADPVNPQLYFQELSKRLPDDAIICSDCGSHTNWYARNLKFKRGMRGTLSGGLATMCPAVAYAIAAKFAYPDRPVIASIGDGAMQMLGNDGMITISKYWKQWADPRLIIFVLDNHDLNQVTWEQRVLSGDPKFKGSQDVPPFDYARAAELVGLRGIQVSKPEQVGDAWEEALKADRPVVIDGLASPDVPPLPPHISFTQARKFAASLLEGDPDFYGIVKESAKHMAV